MKSLRRISIVVSVVLLLAARGTLVDGTDGPHCEFAMLLLAGVAATWTVSVLMVCFGWGGTAWNGIEASVVAAVTLFLAVTLFPPTEGHSSRFFLFSPPDKGAVVDYGRLVVEWAVIAVPTAAAIVLIWVATRNRGEDLTSAGQTGSSACPPEPGASRNAAEPALAQPSQEPPLQASHGVGPFRSEIPPALLARCWGKFIDLGCARVLFESVAALAVVSIGQDIPYERHPVPSYVGTFIAWLWFFLLYEAVLVWATSSTPGKWFMGIRVCGEGIRRPRFGHALSRGHKALARGLYYLVFFPFPTMFALYDCYSFGKRHGRLPWDSGLETTVRCKDIGLLRHLTGFLVAGGMAVGYVIFLRVTVKERFLRDFIGL